MTSGQGSEVRGQVVVAAAHFILNSLTPDLWPLTPASEASP
jgi:hypothetical protein